jgi:DNA-directed RNA polymerase specialized sigma24 family protein
MGVAEPPSVGERDARAEFEDLYFRAWPPVYRYVWMLVRHREDAEDIASESFRRAYAAWQQGRGPKAMSCRGSS